MPETAEFEVIGTPGIVRDTPAHKINPAAFSDGQNVKFNTKGAESLVGDLGVFSTALTTPLWYQWFPPLSNPVWVYADLLNVYTVQGTTHTDITRASGVYAAIPTERWQATVFNGVGVLNNTIDVPQAWTEFNPSTLLVDLPNWDGTRRAKSIKTFKNFLVALNMTDSGINRPYRVLWSDSADSGTVPGSWDSTDPATDSREVDLAQTEDHLVDQLFLGDINVIYKERTTWGMSFIGPPNYFRFWNILEDRGLLHRDCMVQTPLGHCVATQDDIIVHNGQKNQSQSIIHGTLRNWLFKSIDSTNFKNCFMFSFLRNNEVYFCFPEIGEQYATLAIVWNWKEGNIGVRDLSTTPFISIGPVGDSLIEDESWG